MTDRDLSADRYLIVELGGILHYVPARLHRPDWLVTAPLFLATHPAKGECPRPVKMSLHPPHEQTDPRHVVLDTNLAQAWELNFTVHYETAPYRIRGFYPSIGHRTDSWNPVAPRR